MRILLLLFFTGVDYYVVLVYFKQKSRHNAISSLFWLIGFSLISKVATHFLPLSEKYPSNLAQSSLFSFLIILFLSFFCQLVAITINRAINWHQEHNSANLHRQPIRFAIEQQEQLKTLFTYFYFFGSLIILWGVWLGPVGPTL